MIASIKDRVVDSTTGLFSHGPQPLEHTLDHMGDPGLLGPDSVSWPVLGDATAFVGGIRALLVQTAHPEVVAGVEQHSSYRTDPLGRLTRTSAYVTETTYGAAPEVEAAVDAVRRAHVPVHGRSDRGKAYRADNPAMAAWVHNVLTDSFLAAYQAYGPSRLSTEDADRFVEEQTRVGRLLGASPLPTEARDLSLWVAGHAAVEASNAQRAALDFLRRPPLPLPVRAGYELLFRAAVATLPSGIADVLGLHPGPLDARVGAAAIKSLRWALGASPSWHVALIRTGAEVPPGRFRQSLPSPTIEPEDSHAR
jgi:uncharacterized protein (DUF2236 family)